MIRRLLILSLLAGLTGPHETRADDDEDDVVAGVAVRQIRITEQSFGQMVFGGQQQQQVVQNANGRVLVINAASQPNVTDFRKRMESVVTAEILAVSLRLSLTEAQVKKLRFATRDDVIQHISRAEELRPKLTSKPIDQVEYNEMMKQLYPLRMAHQYGFLSDNSPFRKTLRTVLTEEQPVQFQKLERGRQAATIEDALQNIERVKNGLQLAGETRRKFAELFLEHRRVSQNVGPYGRYIVLLEANLIRDRVVPLLNETERETFEAQVVMAKRVEPTLATYGLWTARRSESSDDEAESETKV